MYTGTGKFLICIFFWSQLVFFSGTVLWPMNRFKRDAQKW